MFYVDAFLIGAHCRLDGHPILRLDEVVEEFWDPRIGMSWPPSAQRLDRRFIARSR
jgi:hypothetical protein